MRFSNSLDILLLECVIFVDAHLVGHWKIKTKLREALNFFLFSVPPKNFGGATTLNWKIMNYFYQKIISDHGVAVKQNVKSSGIIDIRVEIDILFDYVVQAVAWMD